MRGCLEWENLVGIQLVLCIYKIYLGNLARNFVHLETAGGSLFYVN